MNNTTTSTTLVVGLSQTELWISLILFFMIGGLLTAIGYVFVAIGIGRNKKLRSRFFIVLWNLVLCRACLSLQFLTMGIYRTLRTLLLVPSQLTAGTCNIVHFWLLVGLTWEMLLLLVLVLDRSVAIMAPILYRQLSRKQSAIICAIIFFVVVLLKVPWGFIRGSQSISCVNVYSGPTDAFNNYSQNIDLAILCLIMVVYAILILFVRRKISILKSQGSESSDSVALKRQLDLMPTLRNLVLTHCGVSWITRSLRMSVGIVSDSNLAARLSAYAGMLLVVDLAVNLIVLVWGNVQVRQTSFPWCTKRHVEPIPVTVTDTRVDRTVSNVGHM